LSVRPYLKHIGLRTTIASIIASSAAIQVTFKTHFLTINVPITIMVFMILLLLLLLLAVSTRPPAGDLSRCTLYCLGPAGLCPLYLSREFCRPLHECAASVRSFISIRQVAPHDLDLDHSLGQHESTCQVWS